LGPPSAPSSGTYPWYLDFDAFFHMTPHSLMFLLHVLLIAIALFLPPMDPLFLFFEQGTLSSDSFHVPDISLVPDFTIQLMSARQITDHDYRVILDHDVCYIQDRYTDHLVGTGPRRHDSQHLWELD
jgi:hypothetical protein